MSKLRPFFIALMLGLALTNGFAAGLSQAAQDSQVTMRSAERADGGRLLIEWLAPIKVLQKQNDNQLILRFSRPLAVDAEPALNRLTSYLDVALTAIEGNDLKLALKPGISAKLEVKKNKIVTIDFSRQQVGEEYVRLDVSTLQNGVRLTLDWPRPTDVETEDRGGRLLMTFTSNSHLKPADLSYLNQTLQPWFSKVQQTSDPAATSLSFYLQPMIVSKVKSRNAHRIDIDLIRDASAIASTAQAGTKPSIELRLDKPTSKKSREGLPPIPVRRPEIALSSSQAERLDSTDHPESQANDTKVDSLVFNWDGKVGAAVFKRAGHLWVVFDAPPELSKSPIPPPAPAPLAAGEVMQVDKATIIRFPMSSDTDFAVLQDDKGRWIVQPDHNPKPPASIRISPAGSTGTLYAKGPSNGRIVSVYDPLVGDQISIWPIQQSGLGQSGRRRFVDLEVLASIQGLVWRPFDNDLSATATFDGIDLTSKQGLALSIWPDEALDRNTVTEEREQSSKDQPGVDLPMESDLAHKSADAPPQDHPTGPDTALITPPVLQEDRVESAPDSADIIPSSYLDLAGSGVDRNLVAETRRVLRQKIAKSSPEKRDRARLELAKLLVSEKFASEAKIVLQTISDRPQLPVILSKRALRGAAAFLKGEIEEASALLQAAEFDEDTEIGIWRAALESLERNWQTAAEGWNSSSKNLDVYPPKLRLELGLLALESAIETNNDNMIRKGFRRLKTLDLKPHEMAQIDRLHALRATRDGDLERAEEILQTLAEGRHHGLSTIADFELATLLQSKNPNDPGPLASLHDRLPLWRGHPNEIDMIDGLARRYRDAKEPREALQLWAYLAEIYPATEDDLSIKDKRRATYVDALTELAGQDIKLLDAYAIYLDFINLLPQEPNARLVHRNLAQHLAGLDLLNEAVLVLRPMMENAADEVEAAEIGAETAELLLLQDRPGEALAALDQTEPRAQNALEIAEGIKRQILKARTLARLDRKDEALKEIRDIQTASARHVRAEILWQQRNWHRLASVIESYLDDPDLPLPLGEDDQKLILWLALAREQLGQTKELNELRQRYTTEMASGPWSEAFIVGTQAENQRGDIASVLRQAESQLAELIRFRESTNTSP